jgi:hypothetical protein
MTLDSYMQIHGLTLSQMGGKAGLSYELIRRARTGSANVGIKSLNAIEKATGGAVTVIEMVAVRQAVIAQTI